MIWDGLNQITSTKIVRRRLMRSKSPVPSQSFPVPKFSGIG